MLRRWLRLPLATTEYAALAPAAGLRTVLPWPWPGRQLPQPDAGLSVDLLGRADGAYQVEVAFDPS